MALFRPPLSHAAIFAPSDDRFATAMMFKTVFDLVLECLSRHCLRQTQSVCARERSDEAIHLSGMPRDITSLRSQ
jgi:hypothetical protein